jgi:hypothetical protein
VKKYTKTAKNGTPSEIDYDVLAITPASGIKSRILTSTVTKATSKEKKSVPKVSTTEIDEKFEDEIEDESEVEEDDGDEENESEQGSIEESEDDEKALTREERSFKLMKQKEALRREKAEFDHKLWERKQAFKINCKNENSGKMVMQKKNSSQPMS